MILLLTALLFLLYGEGRGHSLIPHVTAPVTWRLGVLESVFIRALQQSESFLVKVSLVSYPDKKTTFSSALLQLTPENRFRGAVNLSVTAEDFPGEFVYLVAESKVFREEMRIPVTSAARTPMNDPDNIALRRRRRQSVLTEPQIQEMNNIALRRRRRQSVLIKSQIHEMISSYRHSRIQQCCRDGSDHYSQHGHCMSDRSKELQRSRMRCHQAYEECCKYTENHMYKHLSLISGIQDSRTQPEGIQITVTHSIGEGTVSRTFTVEMDPTQDVSIQVNSPMFNTNIDMLFRAPSPVDGDQ